MCNIIDLTHKSASLNTKETKNTSTNVNTIKILPTQKDSRIAFGEFGKIAVVNRPKSDTIDVDFIQNNNSDKILSLANIYDVDFSEVSDQIDSIKFPIKLPYGGEMFLFEAHGGGNDNSFTTYLAILLDKNGARIKEIDFGDEYIKHVNILKDSKNPYIDFIGSSESKIYRFGPKYNEDILIPVSKQKIADMEAWESAYIFSYAMREGDTNVNGFAQTIEPGTKIWFKLEGDLCMADKGWVIGPGNQLGLIVRDSAFITTIGNLDTGGTVFCDYNGIKSKIYKFGINANLTPP